MKNKLLFLRVNLLLASFAFFLSGNAQIGTWKPYMSYQNATLVAETPNKVFAVYEGTGYSGSFHDGSLLAYNKEDGLIKQYSKEDGLSDIGIQYLAYNESAKALIIVYTNANIDILTDKGFANIASLKNDPYLKSVNNLEMDGTNAYLSTDFGIVVLDLQRVLIKDTYRFNKNTRSVCLNGQYIYAATSEGVYRALKTAVLQDKNNWTYYPLNFGGNDKEITKILFFKEKFTFCEQNSKLYYQVSEGNFQLLAHISFRQIGVIQDQLTLVTPSNIIFYRDLSIAGTEVVLNAYNISSLSNKNEYWLAGGKDGLMKIQKDPAKTKEFTILVSGIQINSPKYNLSYYLTFSQNKLLVAGGGRGSIIINNPGTLMVYENGNWQNFDETAIEKQTGVDCRDFTSAIVDPHDPNHYFAASWGQGLYEFRNNEFVKLYSFDNSKLVSIFPDKDYNRNFVRVDGLAYDKDNNLYMVNAEVQNGIVLYGANGDWTSSYYSPLSGLSVVPQQIIIDRHNQKWVNLPVGKTTGIMVFNDTGSAFSETFTDQQGYALAATGYFCLAQDLNGAIWAGTDVGPVWFNSANQIAERKCIRPILGNESTPYRLMEGIKVTTIAVDGGNRKWMGTAGNGIFCVDMEKEEVVNYTTENSMLFSNIINSIAINNATGEIFIGTDKGLISFKGDAIAGKADYSNVYAFPNPVRPMANDQVVVTGLMEKSTVKITDLNGNIITQGTSAGGQFVWNCRKRNGELVTSGIYLVLASTPEGNQGVVTKIMVIK